MRTADLKVGEFYAVGHNYRGKYLGQLSDAERAKSFSWRRSGALKFEVYRGVDGETPQVRVYRPQDVNMPWEPYDKAQREREMERRQEKAQRMDVQWMAAQILKGAGFDIVQLQLVLDAIGLVAYKRDYSNSVVYIKEVNQVMRFAGLNVPLSAEEKQEQENDR